MDTDDQIQDEKKWNEPNGKDNFISVKPGGMTVEQQISFQLKNGKKRNALQDIIGKWPGDESVEDILKAID